MSLFASAAESALNKIKINAISKETRDGRPVWVKRRRAAGAPVARFANLFFRWAGNPVHVWPRLDAWQKWEISCFRMLNGDAFEVFAEGRSIVCAERLPGKSLSQYLDEGALTGEIIRAAAAEFRRAHLLRCEEFQGPWSHGDPHLANVLYDEETRRARFIDFEMIHQKDLSPAARHADDLLVFLQDLVGRVPDAAWLPLSLALLDTYGNPEVIAELKRRLVVPGGLPRVWWAVRTRCISSPRLRRRIDDLRRSLEGASASPDAAAPLPVPAPVAPPPPKSRLGSVFLKFFQVAVTLAVLAWIFHDPSTRAGIIPAIRGGEPGWLFIGFLVAGIGEVTNIIRWGLFLRVQRIDVSWPRIAALFMIGVFFGLFLLGPAGGDVVKVFLLCREHRTQKAAVFLTIVADRLIGLFVLLPFTLILVIGRYAWLSQTPVARSLLWLLIAFVGASLIFIAGSFLLTSDRVVDKLPPGFPGRHSLVDAAAAYTLFRRAWKESLWALLLSFPVLFTYFGAYYCAARAFRAGVSLLDIFSIMPIITFVTSLPISISGFGLREEMFRSLLHDLDGVPAQIAVLLSLAGTFIYVLWSLIGALAYLRFRPQTRPVPAMNPDPA